MTDRIKVGDVYLELPGGSLKPSVPVRAEKPEEPDSLEKPVFFTPRDDAVDEYIAKVRAPKVEATMDRTAEKRPDQMDEWVAFCAGNVKMAQRWQCYQDKSAATCGFNGFAALFGIQWFFFHRMYAKGIVAIICELAPAMLLAIAAPTSSNPSLGKLVAGLTLMLIVAGMIGVGFWANIALYQRATQEIEKIRVLDLKPEMHLSAIRGAGATSLAPVIWLNAAAVLLRVLPLMLK